jgi:hypothetical protein
LFIKKFVEVIMKTRSKEKIISHLPHEALLRTRHAFARTFMRDPNVQGIAIGFRRKDGVVIKDLALRFYVAQKRAIRHLAGTMIPPRLPLIQADGTPHSRSYINTDIHEVGRFLPAAAPKSGDPLTVGGNKGTTGLVFRNVADGEGYILTAGHVLNPDNSNIQQSIEVESNPPVPGQNPVVLPLRYCDYSITSTASNIDAAVCRVGLPPKVSIQTHDGQPVLGLEDPQFDVFYQMYSRILDRVVDGTDPDMDASPKLSQLSPKNDWALLTDAIIINMEAERGDSGSLLYRPLKDGGVSAVGILVAVSDNGHAVFHKIRAVLSAFQSLEHLNIRFGVRGDIN